MNVKKCISSATDLFLKASSLSTVSSLHLGRWDSLFPSVPRLTS